MTHSPLRPGEETGDNVKQPTLECWLKTVPVMLHSIDSQGRLISVSDAWLAKLGYTREEVLGKESSHFLTPESRDYAIKTVLPAFFQTGRCENIEYQMVCKDGRIIDVHLSAILNRGRRGETCWSIAVITDVTELRAAQQRLSESEALYRCLVEDQPELVSLITPEGDYRFVNGAYSRLFNLRPHEFTGKKIFSFLHGEHHAATAERLQKLSSENPLVTGDSRICLPDGQTRWIAWSNRAIIDAQGNVAAIHSVGRDIEDRIVADQRLKDSESRYRLLAENSTDMVFQLDLELTRQYVSPACLEILGYDPSELAGLKPLGMLHPSDVRSTEEAFRALLDGRVDRQSIVTRVRHRDRHWIWVDIHLRTIKDPSTGAVSGITGALRDISIRKSVEHQLAEANRRLETLAREDSLTRLSNRRAFDLSLAREYRRAQREKTSLALIMIDVDRFKSFNDRYGHPAGDDCLRRISEAIKMLTRRPGDMAARYGGEEFAVLLPATGEHGATAVAEKIRLEVLRLAIEHEASPHGVVTISAGIASAGPIGFNRKPVTLIDHADRALYHAKASDRNTSVRASNIMQASPAAEPV
jgi:diguanylate cyclase (GGDEF)-like protein/PAS domain S-box-containing protein